MILCWSGIQAVPLPVITNTNTNTIHEWNNLPTVIVIEHMHTVQCNDHCIAIYSNKIVPPQSVATIVQIFSILIKALTYSKCVANLISPYSLDNDIQNHSYILVSYTPLNYGFINYESIVIFPFAVLLAEGLLSWSCFWLFFAVSQDQSKLKHMQELFWAQIPSWQVTGLELLCFSLWKIP